MLSDFGIDAKIMPNWVPERLGEPNVYAMGSKHALAFYVDYEFENEFVSIYYVELLPKNISTSEKDYQDADLKKIDGVTHHIIIDKNITKIVWENGELECHITGNLFWEEMEQVLKSIYED